MSRAEALERLFTFSGRTVAVTGGAGALPGTMGRYGEPEELIGAVVWLLSDAASFVTGSFIVADGGFLSYSIRVTAAGISTALVAPLHCYTRIRVRSERRTIIFVDKR